MTMNPMKEEGLISVLSEDLIGQVSAASSLSEATKYSMEAIPLYEELGT